MPSRMFGSLAAPIALRPAQEADLPLLYRVYASTRQEELALTNWDDAQKDWFLRMQFDLQARYYAQVFPEVETQIILCSGEPVGRLMTHRLPDQILLVDIALLPEHRQAGIGTAVMKAVLDEATLAGKAVVLHVDKANRARFLYERLGFAAFEWNDVYLEMRWPAQGDRQ